MPSINMKLEMVTIIACEVDTEVFTSDKMQVWSSQIMSDGKMHVSCTNVCALTLTAGFNLFN